MKKEKKDVFQSEYKRTTYVIFHIKHRNCAYSGDECREEMRSNNTQG